MREIRVSVLDLSVSASEHGEGQTTVVLGHGAGSDRTNPFLRRLAERLAASGRGAVLENVAAGVAEHARRAGARRRGRRDRGRRGMARRTSAMIRPRRGTAVGWWPQARTGEVVSYLTDEEHDRLVASMEVADVEPGDVVLHKGSPSRSLVLVETGELEVFDDSVGESVALAVVGAGSVVGEVGFIDGQARTHSVRARTACRVHRLTRERLLELLAEEPTLCAKLGVALAEIMARRFRAALAELEPVRSFAANLDEPMGEEPQEAVAFDELDEPLPAQGDLVELLRGVGRKPGGALAGV